MTTILTFDLETENHTLNKRKASPFDPRNYIVQIGWNINGGERHEKYYTEHHRSNVLPCLDGVDIINGFNIKFDLLWVWDEPELKKFLKRGGKIWCGQYAEYLMNGMVQEYQMCSMNDIAEKYGGGCKIDAVKEMWEEGYLTSEIPRNLLTDYLIGDNEKIVGDVQNTWLIYIGQVSKIIKEYPPEFRNMIKHRMDGLLASTEMEYNGMHIERELGEQLREEHFKELQEATETLESFIPELPEELTFNWGSNTHKSALIFGGTVKYEKWLPHLDENGNKTYSKKEDEQPLFKYHDSIIPVPKDECKKAGALYVLPVPEGTPDAFKHNDTWYLAQVTFKGGKRVGEGKTKKVKVDDLTKVKGAKQPHYFTFKGYTKPDPKWQGALTDAYDNPMYSSSAEVIGELSKRGLPFTDALSKRTSLAKQLGTYYWMEEKNGKRTGMLTLVGDDSIIHHKLNHTSTVTSRMSSSDPNLQTLPRKDEDKNTGEAKSKVKMMFTSRFDNGLMAEIDYSQLEVVVQGVLTQDKQLCQDLRDGVDFHCKRLASKLHEPYEDVLRKAKKEEIPEYVVGRTNAKVFSFQRAYGAGVATIAESTGMPDKEVQALIDAEERLYPAVVTYDQKLEQHIINNRKSTPEKLFINGIAFTRGASAYDCPTGTRYVWKEHETPKFMQERGKYLGFSPTERKNYIVQGTGGEIVQTMLGKVFRYFLENDMFDGKVLLVNTVHDCVLLDGDADLVPKVAKEVQAILESVPEVFNEAFPKLNITVPFPCETEVGKDLFDMEVLH